MSCAQVFNGTSRVLGIGLCDGIVHLGFGGLGRLPDPWGFNVREGDDRANPACRLDKPDSTEDSLGP